MQIRRLIHIFNDTNEIVDLNGWEVKCHPRNKLESNLSHLDASDNVGLKDKYAQTPDKDEFYKYAVLYHEGGVFARYDNVNDIPFEEINALITYCESRQISLLQCPSLTVVGFVHHPQLMTMLSSEVFHPLSAIYKNGTDTHGHKTLVTSLPLRSYLEKIKGNVPPTDYLTLTVLSLSSLLLGLFVGHRVASSK